jgi:NAD(P)H-dependent flavin oxidoreductase YrpB (nitropropane dioxygenase family)
MFRSCPGSCPVVSIAIAMRTSWRPSSRGAIDATRATTSSRTRASRTAATERKKLYAAWTEAWESAEAPTPLPMPLQSFVSEPALRKVDKLAEGGHAGAKELATYWVGQGVGLMNQSKSVRAVVQEFKEDFLTAYERLSTCLAD